jgi:GTPase SAR1 family protein
MFSINNQMSYDNVKDKWVPEIRHYSPNSPIILVATKTDLRINEGVGVKEIESVDSPGMQGNYILDGRSTSLGMVSNLSECDVTEAAAKPKLLSVEDGLRLGKQVNAIYYIECSALSQQGLHEVFEHAVLAITQAPGYADNKMIHRKKKAKCTIL